MQKLLLPLSFPLLLLINGCTVESNETNNKIAKPAEDLSDSTADSIKLNQLGYHINSPKLASIPNLGNSAFSIVNLAENKVVFSGNLSPLTLWSPAQENVSIANFSGLTAPGKYQIEVNGLRPSAPFSIEDDILLAPHKSTLKAYYFNRASIELSEKYAGVYARAAGHKDTNVMIHASAASDSHPTGTNISSPKGWYDAGDYNKYVVNSCISTYSLLISYEHFSDLYQNFDLNIPESNNAVPDILDEIKWNLDWLETMQDPNDGGVYHKLTTLSFSGDLMPKDADAQRYVMQKTTAAALNFSAVMAVASRIYQSFDNEFPNKAAQYKQAAIVAWQWAQQHSNIAYEQPKDVHTGEYGDKSFEDEFAWAAAELFLLTNVKHYLDTFKSIDITFTTPSWSNTAALGYISLINNGKNQLTAQEHQLFSAKLTNYADKILQQHNQSAYRVALVAKDFVWGSNGHAMNKGMVLLQAYKLTQNIKYKHATLGLVDYVFGKNPTGYSFVTGFGSKQVMHIHHRQSVADNIKAPVPGFLAGGPQNGQQDKCAYPSNLPATSYIDDYCSYSTNEVTINWNAPLVYVLSGLRTYNL